MELVYLWVEKYWKVLKHRLLKKGNETVTECNQLKMKVSDGKIRFTDVIPNQMTTYYE